MFRILLLILFPAYYSYAPALRRDIALFLGWDEFVAVAANTAAVLCHHFLGEIGTIL